MNITGDIAEAAFVYEATKRGFKIFLPTTHDVKSDVVVQRPSQYGQFLGIQVKKATIQKLKQPHHKQRWKFMACSSKPSCLANPKDYSKSRYNTYSIGDFHMYAIYIMERDVWAFYHLPELLGKRSHSWSVGDGPTNNWELFDEFS